MQLKPNEYKCAKCGGIFQNDWSEKGALLEQSENFPGVGVEDCEVVCDDCYKLLMGTINN